MAALMQRMQSIAKPEGESGERIKVIRAGVGNTVRMIPVVDVVCFEATEKYVNVVTPTARRWLRMSLARADGAHRFDRVHPGASQRDGQFERHRQRNARRERSLQSAMRGLQRPLKVSRAFATCSGDVDGQGRARSRASKRTCRSWASTACASTALRCWACAARKRFARFSEASSWFDSVVMGRPTARADGDLRAARRRDAVDERHSRRPDAWRIALATKRRAPSASGRWRRPNGETPCRLAGRRDGRPGSIAPFNSPAARPLKPLGRHSKPLPDTSAPLIALRCRTWRLTTKVRPLLRCLWQWTRPHRHP